MKPANSTNLHANGATSMHAHATVCDRERTQIGNVDKVRILHEKG